LLKYVLKNELIDKVVLGVQTNEQLINNINSLDYSLELNPLEFKIDESIVQPSKWNNYK
jgi:aryl-alcohol dehydrogenase-like predicted oxidoreductase